MSVLGLLSSHGFVMYPREVAHIVGVKAAVLLGEFAFVQNQHGPGFWCTQKMLSDATALSIDELKSACKSLVEHGLVSVEKKGMPARNHYTVNEGVLLTLLENVENSAENVENSASQSDSALPSRREIHCQSAENPPTSRREIHRHIKTKLRTEPKDELSGSQANADAAPEKAGTKDARAAEVIRRLNEKAGTAFREGSKQSARLIDARLREGYTVGELESIVDAMCAEWGGDPRMRDYLRPSTLFNATNAENYLEKARRAAESRSKARKAPTAKADRGSTEEDRKSALKAAREWTRTHGLPASSVCETMAVDGIAVLGADGNSLVKVFRY